MPTRKRAVPEPAPAVMLDLIIGYWLSQLIYVAARLGLADLLARGPKTAAELARRTGANAGALRRALRALASAGVFKEVSGGRFALTATAATLRADHPASMRSFALMMVEGYNWQAWGRLIDGVKTGGVPFEAVHKMKVFEYLAQHPEDGRVFAESMASISATESSAVAEAYDFSRVHSLVDVGGSHGHLLAAILKRNRRLRGGLFDQPSVVALASQSPYVTAPAVAKRVELVPGDFFESVPVGADAYLMKYVLHDWADELCVKILSNCRKAIAPGGRLLVVDTVIPPGNAPHWGKLLDINMLVVAGGRERTREELRALFAGAGFKLSRVIPTRCPLSIVEGVPA